MRKLIITVAAILLVPVICSAQKAPKWPDSLKKYMEIAAYYRHGNDSLYKAACNNYLNCLDKLDSLKIVVDELKHHGLKIRLEKKYHILLK